MGDGKIRKIGIVLNGSSEGWMVKDEVMASTFFNKKGYDLYVASPNKQLANTVAHVFPASKGINYIAKMLEGELDDDDEVVVYMTGHGGDSYGGCLSLKNHECLAKDSAAFKRLFALPYGHRTVILNMCYSGDWEDLLAHTKNTILITGSRKGEQVVGSEFGDRLLAPDKNIPDLNKDKKISWWERFRYAIKKKYDMHPQYIESGKDKEQNIAMRQTKSEVKATKNVQGKKKQPINVLDID